jgi:hypothetical protein
MRKIYLTNTDPTSLCQTFNQSTMLPYPVELELVRSVVRDDILAFGSRLDRLFDSMGTRHQHQFWTISKGCVTDLFDIISEVMYPSPLVLVTRVETEAQLAEPCPPEYLSDDETKNSADVTQAKVGGHKHMADYLMHGQAIRHFGSLFNAWEGVYDRRVNSIMRNGVLYKTPSAFAGAHYADAGMTRKGSGWVECEALLHGVWKKMNTLERRSE